MNNYITAGELAKLADTTKRTIIWYDQMGILKPIKIEDNGYRLYKESQVLEYQLILLLTTLGVSLEEIKSYWGDKGDRGNWGDLFEGRKKKIREEIESLRYHLNSLETYYKNLKKNGAMVEPEIEIVKPFEVYYLEKTGAYVDIGKYCTELYQVFAHHGKNWATMAIFYEPNYAPKKSLYRIGALAGPGTKLKPDFEKVVNKMTFAPGKVISYVHNGPGNLLSLFWKELEKYCRINKIKVRKEVPDFEIYYKVNENPAKQFFKIFLPIE